MATIFSQFDTTVANAVAAIKAAILTSSDWSNPAGQRVQATTTRGADMVVDLADAAAAAGNLQFGVYRTAALADKIIRYMRWRNSGGATTDTLHVTVSAGKEHLFIMIEGPRAGEVNPANPSGGSWRPLFVVCDLVPYFPADTVPAVVCGGGMVSNSEPSTGGTAVAVSRNAANTSSWVPGVLESLSPIRSSFQSAAATRFNGQSLTANGYLARPYVLFEDVAGMRGRLSSFFLLGWNTANVSADLPVPANLRLTIDGVTYLTMQVNANPASSGGCSLFGQTGTTSDVVTCSPVVAVPTV